MKVEYMNQNHSPIHRRCAEVTPGLCSRGRILYLTTILLFLFIHCSCFSETSDQYSELLSEAINKAGMSHLGYVLLSQSAGMGPAWGPQCPKFVEGLDQKEAVPFLLEVIQNGPSWADEYPGTQRLKPHLARCYAVLCLASTHDCHAYPVLSELLMNEDRFIDPNQMKAEVTHQINQQRLSSPAPMENIDISEQIAGSLAKLEIELNHVHSIRIYAAAGLGLLEDPRACKQLMTTLTDANSGLRYQSMYSLAKIGNLRAIEPILDAATNVGLDDYALNSCMQKITKFNIYTKAKWDNRATDLISLEHGDVYIENKPLTSAWLYWYKTGKVWTEQTFYEKNKELIVYKLEYPENKAAVSYHCRQIAELGIAALPLLVEKIKEGQSEFIPLAAQLTDNQVPRNATKEDVLNWWNINKDQWTIFD